MQSIEWMHWFRNAICNHYISNYSLSASIQCSCSPDNFKVNEGKNHRILYVYRAKFALKQSTSVGYKPLLSHTLDIRSQNGNMNKIQLYNIIRVQTSCDNAHNWPLKR